MRKLIEYPSQALRLVHEGQIMVLISNDVEKVSQAIVDIPILIVSGISLDFQFPP